MSKPWEQEWMAEPGQEPQWIVANAKGGSFVANTLGRDDEIRAKFISAAPDMARALMMVVEREDPYSDIHKAAIAALRKAGVL